MIIANVNNQTDRYVKVSGSQTEAVIDQSAAQWHPGIELNWKQTINDDDENLTIYPPVQYYHERVIFSSLPLSRFPLQTLFPRLHRVTRCSR